MISAILASPLTPLEDILRGILKWLGPHGTIGLPWAWSIVALTILVRLLLVPLMVRQIHSMQNLQRHAPQMKEIQKKYKTDKKRQQEELMKFYRENNINPAASCIPLLAQLPVFFALYLVLKHFPHQVGDNLSWLGLVDITDKASAGWGPVLVVVYAVSQLASSYFMSAATADRSQRIILYLMPVAFIPFIINFKAGLVLYWMTTNLWTVGQGLITRRLMPKPQVTPKRSSRTAPREEEPVEDGSREPAAVPAPAATSGPPRRVRKKKKKGGARR